MFHLRKGSRQLWMQPMGSWHLLSSRHQILLHSAHHGSHRKQHLCHQTLCPPGGLLIHGLSRLGAWRPQDLHLLLRRKYLQSTAPSKWNWRHICHNITYKSDKWAPTLCVSDCVLLVGVARAHLVAALSTKCSWAPWVPLWPIVMHESLAWQ